eukprot:TRINITY_DN2567_c1_g1::TRINITY_DN2567_c1_g1_i2::g.19476::m.19476 TRINITY_DN2567_c1_g1::TRINITY_DN2567_c1_g1_i2::g.19476  ORF type:complete len:280 (-),score=52.40,sp/Q86I22/FAHD1_DICDI/62.24/4e-81,FAA_hydrolase/PF01557.13/5.4e-53 TRINITY_DN2567_c1_g1_i2:100-939(-)
MKGRTDQDKPRTVELKGRHKFPKKHLHSSHHKKEPLVRKMMIPSYTAYSGKKLITVLGKKIVAVGRNYVKHAEELKNPVPELPLIFLKPTSSIITEGKKSVIEIPDKVEVHHEVELGVVIGKAGRDISEDRAMNHVAGYVVALDLTGRNLQSDAKAKGLPWTVSKGFDTFCPISKYINAEKIDPHNVTLWCKVDGQMRQQGSTSHMIFRIPRLISYISGIMKLEQGDLILTGTPEGVGPLLPGQTIEAGLSLSNSEKSLIEMKYQAVQKPGGMWRTTPY